MPEPTSAYLLILCAVPLTLWRNRNAANSKRHRLVAATRRSGFTLVELLVVIAIIGILVALLLPAIQAARETARRSQCNNHIKNITLAMISHENVNGFLPSGGWRGNVTGDPDLGIGNDQPGGWVFAILPYIEEQSIYDLGAGNLAVKARQDAFTQRDETPIALMNCPSRRPAAAYPHPNPSANPRANTTGYRPRGDVRTECSQRRRHDRLRRASRSHVYCRSE